MKLIHDIEDLEPSLKDKLIFLATPLSGIVKPKKLMHKKTAAIATAFNLFFLQAQGLPTHITSPTSLR